MICKYCSAELEEGTTPCPYCGQVLEDTDETVTVTEETEETPMAEEAENELPELTETVETTETDEIPEVTEAPKKKLAAWKIVSLIVGGVLVALALAAVILYSMGFRLPKGGILGKTSYTVSDEIAAQKKTAVVATMEDKQLTNEALQVYYWLGVHTYLESNQAYLSMMGLDISKPFSEQTYAGKEGYNWEQYFLENAIGTWKQYAALSIDAEKSGFRLSEQEEEYLNGMNTMLEESAKQYGLENAEVMIQTDMGAAGSVAGYTDYMRTYLTALGYYSGEYEKMVPSDEDLESYFAEHEKELAESGITKDSKTVSARHILLQPEGGTTDAEGKTTYSEEEWEACRVKAQAIYDEWQAGEATEESFAALATEKTEDPGSKSTGGLYENFAEGAMVQEFNDWCFDAGRNVGDHGMVKTQFGYHIMYFVGSQPIWNQQCRDRLLAQRTDELIKKSEESHPAKINYKNIVLGNVSLTEQ